MRVLVQCFKKKKKKKIMAVLNECMSGYILLFSLIVILDLMLVCHLKNTENPNINYGDSFGF